MNDNACSSVFGELVTAPLAGSLLFQIFFDFFIPCFCFPTLLDSGVPYVISLRYILRDLFIYLFFSLFKVDLHLTYKKPINVSNNTAYISVNKLLNNNDNNETKYLIIIDETKMLQIDFI